MTDYDSESHSRMREILERFGVFLHDRLDNERNDLEQVKHDFGRMLEFLQESREFTDEQMAQALKCEVETYSRFYKKAGKFRDDHEWFRIAEAARLFFSKEQIISAVDRALNEPSEVIDPRFQALFQLPEEILEKRAKMPRADSRPWRKSLLIGIIWHNKDQNPQEVR